MRTPREYSDDAMSDWPTETMGLLREGIRAKIEKAVAICIAETRAAAIAECTRVASHFSVKPDRSLHPDIPWEQMNESVKMAAHSTAQQIAMEIRDLATPKASE